MEIIDFPGQTVIFYLQHVTHILKATNLTVHLVYLGTLYVHPVTRQIFRNIVVRNWHHWLKPCHNALTQLLDSLLSVFSALEYIVVKYTVTKYAVAVDDSVEYADLLLDI